MNLNVSLSVGGSSFSDPRLAHLHSIISDSFALESELQRLSRQIYPAPELKELIDTGLIPVNRRLRDIFITAHSQILNTPNWRPSSQLIAAQGLWIRGFLHRIVRSISSADIKSHPLEIMTIVRFWLDKAGFSECGVMTTPKDELNFSIAEEWSTVAALLQTEVGIDPGVSRKYVNLTFPRLYKDNALMSGIYAHELGHFLDNQFSLWEKVFTVHASRHPALSSISGRNADSSGRPLSYAQLIASLRSGILGSWIREMVADTFGVLLLGPAFFFAANMIESHRFLPDTLQGNPPVDILSVTHPSTSLRVKHRLKLLDHFGYLARLSPTLTDHVNTIAAWSSNTDAKFMSATGLVAVPTEVSVIETVLKDCLPHITSVVSQAAAGLQFPPEKLSEAETLAKDRLAHLIPPNELSGHPVEPAVILNSGWYVFLGEYEIQRLDHSTGHDDYNNQMQVLHGLLRYALHASYVHRRWNQL